MVVYIIEEAINMEKYERVMKKVYKFYDNPHIDETFDLDYSIVRYIIPRLKMFVEESSKIIDWDQHKKLRDVDVIGICNSIIDDFEFFVKTFDDEVGIKDLTDYKSGIKRVKHGFNLLSKVIGHLGW